VQIDVRRESATFRVLEGQKLDEAQLRAAFREEGFEKLEIRPGP
jgi:hypothetical protein